MNKSRISCLLYLLLFFTTGATLAQTDGQYVIKRIQEATPGDNYLAHVYNTTTNAWELQMATSFSPDCIWYSGTRFNPDGTNHNYYFFDGENYRFLSAPLEADGELSLSHSTPPTQLLRNTEQIYYFTRWDSDAYGAGVARGMLHDDKTQFTCEHSWGGDYGDNACWEVYWVMLDGNTWKLTSQSYYSIYEPNSSTLQLPNAARYRSVTATEHSKTVTEITAGELADLSDFSMDFHDTHPLSITATNYSYKYIPAYTSYEFEGGTHNYYNNGDQGTNTPGVETSNDNTVESYLWTVSPDGAEYLSFDDPTIYNPTLSYNLENTTGHKTVTLTLTVTYSDGSTQVRTANILVKTPCQKPSQTSVAVNYEGAVVSWINTADSYKVYWKKDGGSWNSAEVGSATSYEINNLDYNSTYTYKVVAICGGTEQSGATEHTFTTDAEPSLLVYGSVFGGGRMADVGGNTEVIVVNCQEVNAVYGGNDIAGKVLGNDGSKITLGVNAGDPNDYDDYGTTKSTIKIGDVYGGGNGYYAYNGTSFTPAGKYYTSQSVEVNGEVKAMTQSHEVGETVWTNTGTEPYPLSFPDIKKTAITVTNNYVKVDSIFGGAKNAFLTLPSPDVETDGALITINGGTVFSVFGGNNFGGTQATCKHHIVVNDTKTNLSTGIVNTDDTGYGRDFGIRYLFGGGNKVAGSVTDVVINGGQCDTIFGGGNSADVLHAKVTVDCAIAEGSGNTFGKVYSNAISSYSASEEKITAKTTGYDWNGFSGIYNVRTLFGGNNQEAMANVPRIILTSGSVGTVYGGGNAGDMLAQETNDGSAGTLSINGDAVKYGTHVEMNSGKIIVDNLYGGCQMSNVNYSTWVEIKDGHVGNVYGGCNVSGDVGSSRVNTDAPGPKSLEYQAVQGGTYVVATGGTVYKNIFAGSNGYYHCTNDGVHFSAGLNYDPLHTYVGKKIPTHNETHVVLSDNILVKGNVYAGGNLAPVGFNGDNNSIKEAYPYFPYWVGLASVRMSGGTVEGNVFGGGNMASIYGSNEVQVSAGTINDALYGGNDRTGQVAAFSNRVLPSSYNYASDGYTSLEQVNTYVGLTGTPNINTVFGGGNGYYAYFSTFEQASAYTGPLERVVSCNIDDQPIQSNTFVDVNVDYGPTGGHIGTVFGGGDGVTVTGFLKVFLNINEPSPAVTYDYNNVETIFGGNNEGDLSLVPDIILLRGQVGTVYGGCNKGAMIGSRNITIGEETYSGIGSYVLLPHEYVAGGHTTSTTAVVKNAVYGGCKMNGVTHNTLVLVQGRDYSNVGIYGGCDISGDVAGTSQVIVNDGLLGDLYGGGNGNYTYTGELAGLSRPYCHETYVRLSGGTINNAYAGGFAGECGSTLLEVDNDNCGVYNIFGGGNQAGVTTSHNITVTTLDGEGHPVTTTTSENTTGSTSVEVTGGYVYTGVYGGCNNSGDIAGDVEVNIVKGTIGATGTGNQANIHGGGYGASTTTSGDVTVNIGVIDAASASVCPVIYGDVYGGSALGSVNNGSTDVTTVNYLNGTLHGNLYGGGLGDPADQAKGWVNGQVVVNVGSSSQATANCFIDLSESLIFGCNNTNGSPQDNVTVNIYKTAHNTTNSYPNPVPTVATALEGATSDKFAIQAVYGGGNLADYAPESGSASSTKETTVHVYGCDENTIKDVFGGSNKASAQNTHVIIEGGRIDRTFGGGNGQAGPAPVVGTAKTDIYAGLITQVFGGSNTNGNVGNIELTITQSTTCPELILEVFNGSNQAALFGDVVTNLEGECYDPANPRDPDSYYFYGGTNLAPLYGNVTLNVYGGYYVNVFGGSKGYIDPLDPTNNVSANIMRFPTKDEVNAHPENYPDGLKEYLTAHPEAQGTGGNVTLNIYGGKIENAFGGSDVLGDIEGKITVNVLEGGGSSKFTLCPLDLDTVYGGGKETEYNPITAIVGASRLTPEVNILKGTVKKGVYGGGLGATATVTANPVVTIGDITSGHEAYVASVGAASTRNGNVYGGGELAQVNGNTKIVIQQANSVIEGTVYGGGKGSDENVNHGLVKGNTWVEMTGGQIHRSIYGGGELGSVGDFTEHYAANEDPLHVAGEPKECADETGITKVTVSGGMVGLNEARMPDPADPPLNDDFGYIFCAGKGLSDSITHPLANLLAMSDSSYLEISGTAVITGSVYGGSENGQVIHGTYVKIMGGQIGTGHYKDDSGHHWDGLYYESDWDDAITKIKNGTFTETNVFHQCDAWPFKPEGQRYVYDYYATFGPDANGNYYYDAGHNQSALGGSHSAGDGHSFYGNVFGGGSGYYPYAPGKWRRSAGRVCGNTLVEVVGGHILTNIYGGNELTDVLGKSTVKMTGGTVGVPRSLGSIQARPVNSYIFGAGMGDPRTMFNGWSNVGSAEVIIGDNAVVFGSIFGGGEDGHVLGDVTTTVNGNTLIGTLGTSGVDGNIFGGGRGFSANALTAGVICGNVTVNIGGNVKILGSVFGGGRMAAVGTYLAAEGHPNYGAMQEGNAHGNITVNITGGTIGNVYKLNDSQFSIGDVFGGSKGTLMNDWAKSQKLGLVKNTEVNISQASGNTTLIYGNVYGGGEIASVGSYHYATDGEATSYNTTHPTEPMAIGDVYYLNETGAGTARVIITGGTIGKQEASYTKGHVFGGCLGRAGTSYSGYSYVNQSVVTLNGGTVLGSVFGGGENGHILDQTQVNIQSGTVGIQLDNLASPDHNTIYRGNVYGGGRGIDTYNNGSTLTYSITAGKVSGNTNVSVTGGTIYRNVYGGGSLASVGDPDEQPDASGNYATGHATVSIMGGQIGTDGGYHNSGYYNSQPFNHLLENGAVFGSGRGVAGEAGSEYTQFAYVKSTQVTIGGNAYVTGSVFGSGENGHVRLNTKVTINKDGSNRVFHNDVTNQDEPYPIIGYPLSAIEMVEDVDHPVVVYRGNVYGSGRGIDHTNNDHLSLTAGITLGYTEVEINGGTIHHNVYGGGSLASVGDINTPTPNRVGDEKLPGDAYVTIKGSAVIGTKGVVQQNVNGSMRAVTIGGFNNGQVYGSGRGVAGDAQSQYINMAYTKNTFVTIGSTESGNNPEILGSVFGGGSNGHVKEDSKVTMYSGTVGTSLATSEVPIKSEVYRGNVYGGGRGIDHLTLTNMPLSVTAGVVYGNTTIDIQGGHVLRNVYGGGSIATVGTEKMAGPGEPHNPFGIAIDQWGNVIFEEGTGTTNVSITGGQIGTDGGYNGGTFNHLLENGHVFGSGRGVAGDQGTEYIDLSYVVNTNVTIGGTAYVTGSVFGSGENGHVRQNTNVTVNAGTGFSHEQAPTTSDIEPYPIIGYPLTRAEMVEQPTDPVLIYRGNVYGGGRGIDHTTNNHLSETAGAVKGNTNVTINGGTVRHNVYGGGSLASTGNLTDVDGVITYHDNTGRATVTINGGLIGMSPELDICKIDANTNLSGLNNGQVYGAARGVAGGATSEYTHLAYVHDTKVEINGDVNTTKIFGAVFGGGANGHVRFDTDVKVNGGQIGFPDIITNTEVYRGNVYGGGRGIDFDTENHTISRTAGLVMGNTNITIDGTETLIYRNVYGGGSMASVGTITYNAQGEVTGFADNTGTTTVTVNGGQIGIDGANNGRVFGAGRGRPGIETLNIGGTNVEVDFSKLTYVKDTWVALNDGTVKGCVFGSGDNGHTWEDTHVDVNGGIVGTNGSVVDGNVYGGGRGQDTYGSGLLSITAGKTFGNTHVTMKSGTVKGNIYGGGDMSAVADTTNVTVEQYGERPIIGVSSYDAGGNVFGAGRGNADHREFALVNNTIVNINGDAAIQNNVYGGGEIGSVTENTNVTIATATLKDVYGAGKGTSGYNGSNANIGGYTQVTINSGTIKDVYGGGENGTVRYAAGGASSDQLASRVNLNGGLINNDVFGGGNQGTTQGRVIVNMTGGTVKNEVFGGARGTTNLVFVAGLKTVNMHGGIVYEHIYGGSRDANDGMSLLATSANSSNATTYTAFVNVSGGQLRGDVYGAGYFGTMFGSSDVNIGTDAINNANSKNIDRNDIAHAPAYLHIIKSVYAGSNWGEYDPHNPFQSSTTTGHSNVYLDGNGYDTETLTPPANPSGSTYMDIGGSVYGSGTSGDAGTRGRKVQIANYGTAINGPQTLINFEGTESHEFTVLNSSTRSMQSVQRCDTLIFDNVNLRLTGQGDISQNFNTVEYSITYINRGVYVRNGCNLIANMQIDEIHSIYSQYRPETVGSTPNGLYVKNPTTYWIGIDDTDYNFYYINGSTPAALHDTLVNTLRFDGGYSMYVRYSKDYYDGVLHDVTEKFGQVNGFFRMVTEHESETFAYARPKITGTSSDENTGDGGFMSYYNTGHNTFTDAGSAYTKGKQFPYENVLASSKSDRADFRYWRIISSNTGNQMVSPMAFFLYSDPNNTDDFITIERTITLPTLTCTDDAYFVLSNIDFGDHAHLVNAAIDHPDNNSQYWIVQQGDTYTPRLLPKTPDPSDPYYSKYDQETTDMRDHPNNFFGLVLYPEGSLVGVANPNNASDVNHEYLLSNDTREMITQLSGVENPAKFYYPSAPNGQMAKMTIRLTYYKEMTMSLALSPITIELKSYCGSSANPIDVISVPIYITTQTALGQDMSTTTYAMFGSLASGNNPETYNVKATMPPFNAFQPDLIGKNIPFYIYDLKYTPSSEQTLAHGQDTPDFKQSTASFGANDYEYAMVFKRGFNSDNKSGWREAVEGAENNYFTDATPANPVLLGTADGRNPFSIDFTLYYNSCSAPEENYISNKTVGTMTFKMCYPITSVGLEGTPDPNDATNWKAFNINVDLYKRNSGVGYYLDGIGGYNTYSGEYADLGKKTLQGVLDNDWKPGDKIYVVRPIKITSSTTTWTKNDGATITLYRYPGKSADPDHYANPTGAGNYHGLKHPGENTGVYDPGNGSIQDDGAIFANITEKAYLTMDNVVIDGNSGFGADSVVRPLISVSDGGTVVMQNNCAIRNGNIIADNAEGGAIYLGNNGKLVLMDGVTITNNTITNTTNPGMGAGIYLDDGGSLTVGGAVNIMGNKVNGQENNVYLHVKDDLSNIEQAVVTIDEAGLDSTSRIGVYKDKFIETGNLKDLTPIATSLYVENIQKAHTNENFVDDTRKGYTHYFVEKVLYYGKTWAHFVTNSDPYDATTNPGGIENGSFVVDGSGKVTISSAKAMAWFLSYVNGLNGSEIHPNVTAELAADIDMSDHYWKPIGIVEENGCPNGFVGSFDGQWHNIDGLVIKRMGFHNLGLFDNVGNGGVVKNLVVGAANSNIEPWNPDETEQYTGGVVGTVMNGGVVTACESMPVITASNANNYTYLGGVAGRIANGGTVHSVMGMPTLTGYTMGGLVGKIETGGNLVNSFSNIKSITSIDNTRYVGGLVGHNQGRVENCYSQLQCTEPASLFGWFVGNNTGGTVKYCYSPEGETNYVYYGPAPSGHGNYGAVVGLKDIGYLYDDNKITLASGQTNTHHSNTITYANGRIDQWPGMLSALNHWVKTENGAKTITYDPWFRPLTPNINNDLPVLGLPDYNAVAALDSDPNVLEYGDLDPLLATYNAGNADASLLVYDNATEVANVPDDDVKVFVNEDVALLQASTAGNFKATVGVTFDNSSRTANDSYGGVLKYDWHLMSTPLSNAKIGATYSHKEGDTYTPDLLNIFQESPVDISSLVNSYFPNGLPMDAGYDDDRVKWDFYNYFEPEYHWINLKRNKNNHFHQEAIEGVEIPGRDFQYDIRGSYKHYRIYYDEPATVTADQSAITGGDEGCVFVPGKGYMMAISHDSYMNSTGTLNRGDVTIKVTNSTGNEIPHPDWPNWPSYDWGSNLVGNPFQAYLDLDVVSTETVNVGLNKFWVYDADVMEGSVKGLYKPYTKGASQNPAIPSRYIHPHQAFFVVYTPGTGDPGTKDMVFKYNMAGTTKNEYSFYRSNDSEQPAYPLVNLYVSDTLGNADLAIVEFNRPEMDGVKKVDNLRNADFKLYARMEGEDYGLLFTPEGTERVPVFFKTPDDGTYTLTWEKHNGTFSSMYLIDNITGVRYDMLSHDSYTFEAHATDYAARFYIVFSVTDVDEFEDPEINNNFAYFNGYGWVIEGQGQLELVDMLGRVLYTDHLFGEETLVHFDGVAAGMYMIRLVDGTKLKAVQRIVIRK